MVIKFVQLYTHTHTHTGIECQKVPCGGIPKKQKRLSSIYKMGTETILKSKEEKDVGVVIQDTLSPDRHINRIFGSTYNLLTNISGV